MAKEKQRYTIVDWIISNERSLPYPGSLTSRRLLKKSLLEKDAKKTRGFVESGMSGRSTATGNSVIDEIESRNQSWVNQQTQLLSTGDKTDIDMVEQELKDPNKKDWYEEDSRDRIESLVARAETRVEQVEERVQDEREDVAREMDRAIDSATEQPIELPYSISELRSKYGRQFADRYSLKVAEKGEQLLEQQQKGETNE